MIVDFRTKGGRAFKNAQLIDRETGEQIEHPPWFYADDEAGVLRCYRRTPGGRDLLGPTTPDGLPTRITGGPWRVEDGTPPPERRREALYPDGEWREFPEDKLVMPWDEVRPDRPFKIVVREPAGTPEHANAEG